MREKAAKIFVERRCRYRTAHHNIIIIIVPSRETPKKHPRLVGTPKARAGDEEEKKKKEEGRKRKEREKLLGL